MHLSKLSLRPHSQWYAGLERSPRSTIDECNHLAFVESDDGLRWTSLYFEVACSLLEPGGFASNHGVAPARFSGFQRRARSSQYSIIVQKRLSNMLSRQIREYLKHRANQ